MSGPDRIYPPRLREIQAREEEERLQLKDQRKRRVYLFVGTVLLLLLFPLGYGLIKRNIVRSGSDSTRVAESLEVASGEQIQVNVLNACGVDGVAQKVGSFLRARRFDVPEYGNGEGVEPLSLVIDRTGDSLSARKVAYALGLPAERVITEIDSTLFLKATVVIGQDYHSMRPFQE